MALKDRFRKAIGRDGRSSSVSTTNTSLPGTGATTPNHPLTATSTNTTSSIPKDTSPNATTTNIPTTINNTSPKNSPTHTTTPLTKETTNTPGITLTKTLTKTLTWTSHKSRDSTSSFKNKPSKQEKKEQKALEAWKKQDAEEWKAPKSSRPGKKNQGCQDTLRAFDFDAKGWGNRTRSICSGISPSQSRKNSFDVGEAQTLERVRSGGNANTARMQSVGEE